MDKTRTIFDFSNKHYDINVLGMDIEQFTELADLRVVHYHDRGIVFYGKCGYGRDTKKFITLLEYFIEKSYYKKPELMLKAENSVAFLLPKEETNVYNSIGEDNG